MKTENSQKEFLYVSYLFPPLIGGGVVRAEQMCKMLPDSGWKPSMLTCQVGDALDIDGRYREIGVEVIRASSPVREDKVRSRPTGSKIKNALSTHILRRLARWVFLPDRQILWKRDAVKKALVKAKEHDWQCVLGTLHPVSSAWTGYAIARRLKIPFILEFRDVVSEKFEGGPPTLLHRRLLRSIVTRMAHHAAKIIVVSNAMKEAVAEKYNVAADKIEVITNGYLESNKEQFQNLPKHTNDRFTMIYAGNFYRERNPYNLLKAMQKLTSAGKIDRNKIRIILISNLSVDAVLQYGLEDIVEVMAAMPREEVFRWYAKSDVLLLICDKSFYQNVTIPGKVFEYFMTEKPILGLLDKSSDTAKILEQSGVGMAVDADDIDEIATQIEKLYRLWRADNLVLDIQKCFVNQFNFQHITSKLVHVLEDVTKNVPDNKKYYL